MYEAALRIQQGDEAYFHSLSSPELSALIVGRDDDGRTLLHSAAATGRLGLVDLLARHGAAKVVNKQDDEVSQGQCTRSSRLLAPDRPRALRLGGSFVGGSPGGAGRHGCGCAATLPTQAACCPPTPAAGLVPPALSRQRGA
jgi:hypothetical protein